MPSLGNLLEDALRVRARSDDLRGAVALTDALLEVEERPSKAARPLLNLFQALKDTPQIRKRAGMMQTIGSFAERLDPGMFTRWLIHRGAQFGSARAVADLRKYFRAKAITCQRVTAIEGITIDRRVTVLRGISLVPWDQLPDSPGKRTSIEHVPFAWGVSGPSVAVIKRHRLPVKLSPADGPPPDFATLDEADLRDTVSCLGLVSGGSPVVLASWLDVPPWVPNGGSGVQFGTVEGRPRRLSMSKSAVRRAGRLVVRLQQLPSKRKSQMRLILSRLLMSRRRWSPVDAAIDLGIALEALFLADLDDGRGEMTFRLRLRGARFLRTSYSGRQEVFRVLGAAYRVRSIAVHTGALPEHLDKRPIKDLLDDAGGLVAEATIKLVRGREPQWERVSLG